MWGNRVDREWGFWLELWGISGALGGVYFVSRGGVYMHYFFITAVCNGDAWFYG